MYPSCIESYFKFAGYMNYINLHVLMSFKVTTVTTITCWLNKVGTNIQLPYKAWFGGARMGPTDV